VQPLAARFGRETVDPRGRVKVRLCAGHPYANTGGWQWRYRLVVSYALGRRLRTDEHVDHVNGKCSDDRLENLRLLVAEYHGRLHARLFEIAGGRSETGQFREIGSAAEAIEAHEVTACRSGAVIWAA
jgi:hypothetical protein